MPTYSLINNGDSGLSVRTTLNDLLGDINNGVYIGPTGADGTSGVSGTSGTSGVDGTSGVNGTSGTSGVNGTSGINGTSGLDGTSGLSGTSGIDGTSGTSGVNPTGATAGSIGLTIDGAGSAITTGVKGYITIPYDCEIVGWTILADQSGSIVVDVWKDTYANFPPTSGDSIAGTEKPTLSSAQKNEDTDLTSWTTSVSNGDIIAFNVDSASGVERVNLTLKINKV